MKALLLLAGVLLHGIGWWLRANGHYEAPYFIIGGGLLAAGIMTWLFVRQSQRGSQRPID